MQFDPRGLVIRPLVVGMGLVHDRRRMRAVAGDGHHRQQYGENGCHYSDLAAQRIVFAVLLAVVTISSSTARTDAITPTLRPSGSFSFSCSWWISSSEIGRASCRARGENGLD